MSRHRSGFELSITTVASRLGILRRRTASHFCDYNYSTTGLTTTTFYHFVLPFSFFLIFRGIRPKKKKKNGDKNIGGKLRAHVYIMLFFFFFLYACCMNYETLISFNSSRYVFWFFVS